jgi:threonine/homoserine/homoserine lactone efflux protein
VLINTIYALLVGSVGRLLANHLRFLRLKRYFTGGVYVASGISTALVGSDNSG